MAEEKKVAATEKATTKKVAPKKAAPKKEVEVKEEKVVKAKKETAHKAKKAAPKKETVKKETKKEEKLIPLVKEAKAIAKSVRVTPRKARLVIDLVRGKSIKEAYAILNNVNKAASTPVLKLIKSAASNAVNNFNLDENLLYVATIFATDGIRMKRFMPRAKGSASGKVKRTSHLVCVVKER